jgi:Allene oxide cyclase barrel like domain
MTRLLTLVALSLAMAVAPAFGEAGAQRLHVTAKIVEQTFTGDLAAPQIGDKLITSVELFDKLDKKVGTGEGVCTIVSAPPPDIRIQCLSTAVFPNGQIIFGGFAPSLPEVGAVGRFGILGGTDAFRTARGEATLVVLTPELQDATFDLE